MKENADKYLDQLARKVMKDASVERPSFDFTDVVMSQVSTLNHKPITVYKPLISKRTWVYVSIAFAALVLVFIFGPQTEGAGWFSSIDLSVLSNNKVTNTLSSFTLSKTFMYALVFLGVMFFIQVSMLKHNFDKRFKI